MMHVSNLLDLSKIREERRFQEESDLLTKETAAVINWLFTELRSYCTAFKQAWPDNDSQRHAKKTWLKAFILAGINNTDQLRHGLKHCLLLERPFVPSPGEFIAWCKPKPEDIGLPDLRTAYNLSISMNGQFSKFKPGCQKTYSVIRHVLEQIGSFAYRSMTASQAFKTFESYYPIACKQFMDGKLQEIPKQIPENPVEHPGDRERSNAARLKAMEAIRNMGIAVTVMG